MEGKFRFRPIENETNVVKVLEGVSYGDRQGGVNHGASSGNRSSQWCSRFHLAGVRRPQADPRRLTLARCAVATVGFSTKTVRGRAAVSLRSWSRG